MDRRKLLSRFIGGAAVLALAEAAGLDYKALAQAADERPTGETVMSPVAPPPYYDTPDGQFTASASTRLLGARWATGSHIIVENRIGPAYADVIESRANAWAQRSGGKFTVQSVNPTHRQCAYVSGRIVICGANLGGTLAGTSQNAVTGPGYRQIFASLIRIDEPVALQNQGFDHETVLHELGHSIGLDHTSADSVMRPFVKLGNNLPKAYDVNSIEIMYNQPWGV